VVLDVADPLHKRKKGEEEVEAAVAMVAKPDVARVSDGEDPKKEAAPTVEF